MTLGVSLLPLPGIIIEKLLYNQLIRHFENNTLLNPKQNGFRKLHNTSDTVFKLCYDLSNSMKRKHPTAAVFVDFAKAFDSIDHVKFVTLSSIEMTLVLNYGNIQGDLNLLYKWCFTNGLTINSRKTKVGNFGNIQKRIS